MGHSESYLECVDLTVPSLLSRRRPDLGSDHLISIGGRCFRACCTKPYQTFEQLSSTIIKVQSWVETFNVNNVYTV